jgi:peptidoglycan hydrolase CwlO-like protein
MFMGEPSPALAKIRRMNMADLTAHIERMDTDRDRLKSKVKRLREQTEPPGQKMRILGADIKRLEGLLEEARKLLSNKEDRKKQYELRGR